MHRTIGSRAPLPHELRPAAKFARCQRHGRRVPARFPVSLRPFGATERITLIVVLNYRTSTKGDVHPLLIARPLKDLDRMFGGNLNTDAPISSSANAHSRPMAHPPVESSAPRLCASSSACRGPQLPPRARTSPTVAW